ncbi:MAG: DctP family TRAP transporter solute-binding subunit [Synergistaceae bacterium]|nr:DctP family TRAP transporter solute-binding subunit [Synergistaceae bacterium]
MSNRKSFFKAVCCFVVTFASVLSAGAVWASEFKLSNQFPPSHHLSKGMIFFADKVNEYSGGKVKCKIFDSAQLYKDTEIVEALQDGVVEVGLVPTNKWSGMIPAIDVFEVPFIFSELPSIKKFLDAGASDLFNAEFSAKGVKDIFWVDYGYVQFFNSKRPLKTPNDFKGLSMRAFSSGDAAILAALGAAPTIMSSSEMYMALQRGTVDGATTGMPAAVSRKISEIQKYLTISNYSCAQFVVQGNLKWWNSLPDDEKDAITKAGRDTEAWVRDVIAESEAQALSDIKAAGLEIHTLTQDERDLFAKATASVWDEFAAKTGDLGKKLLDFARSID